MRFDQFVEEPQIGNPEYKTGQGNQPKDEPHSGIGILRFE
jgi:hypothetical protein